MYIINIYTFSQCTQLKNFYLDRVFLDNLSCKMIQYSSCGDKTISLYLSL